MSESPIERDEFGGSAEKPMSYRNPTFQGVCETVVVVVVVVETWVEEPGEE